MLRIHKTEWPQYKEVSMSHVLNTTKGFGRQLMISMWIYRGRHTYWLQPVSQSTRQPIVTSR